MLQKTKSIRQSQHSYNTKIRNFNKQKVANWNIRKFLTVKESVKNLYYGSKSHKANNTADKEDLLQLLIRKSSLPAESLCLSP